MNFGSYVDGVVAASCALVNVATPGERQGRGYTVPAGDALRSAVGRALAATGNRRAATVAPRALPAFLELAGGVRTVYELVDSHDLDGAAAAVNDLLTRYAPHPFLERHDGEPWHLHFHGPEPTDRTGWGGSLAMGLATVLGSEHADRLGVCAAPACDRVFVDVSKNGNRRFCSEACQNRVKAAAHRARQRAADASR